MHSVQKRDTTDGIKRPDRATNRLSTFAGRETEWTERSVAPYDKCYHTSHQDDKIVDVEGEQEITGESSNGSDADVEKGIDGQKLWTHGLA